jgi:hypothetical protein
MLGWVVILIITRGQLWLDLNASQLHEQGSPNFHFYSSGDGA